MLAAVMPVLAGKPAETPVGPAEKVEICHLTPNYETSDSFISPFGNQVVANYGHIVNVSVNAADAHYAHGDPEPVFLTEQWKIWIPDFDDNDSECVIWTAAQ